MKNEHLKKLMQGFVAIIVFALAIWLVAFYFDKSSTDSGLKYYEDLTEQYENDFYGGETPEETLALFIEALEARDIDLASKYFLPEDWEEQVILFEGMKQEDDLTRIIKEAKDLRLSRKDEEEAFFTLSNDENIVEVQVILGKNQNGVWKMVSL